MDIALYIICQLLVVAIVFGMLGSLHYGLSRGLRRIPMPEINRRRILQSVRAGGVLWLLVLAVLAMQGFFRDFSDLPPRILLVATLPPVFLIFILLVSRTFRLLLKVIPESWFFYVQAFRILMELMLWLGYKGGFVPPQMTFEWLNFDIIVGITAPMAAYVFFGRGRYRRLEGIIWNVFGIVLLLNVVVIAYFSTPAPWRVFYNEPALTFVSEVPFIWIPGFIVPFALGMHVFSLVQLLTTRPQLRRYFKLRRRQE